MQTERQATRREEIVQAAQRVILRVGPAGCTSRVVAAESGLNKGLVHYYFPSVDAIVDAAMGRFAEELQSTILVSAAGVDDPRERFWVVVENYLGVFDAHPGLALAWYEYWLLATRAGRLEQISPVQTGVIGALTTTLEANGVEDAPMRARILVSYILGVLIRGLAQPHDFDDLRPEISALAAIAAPR